MKFSKYFATLGACALGAATLTGCTFEAGLAAPPPIIVGESTGSLTVRWTVAGAFSPAECAYYRVDMLELVIYDAAGTPFFTTEAPCENFDVTLDLDPGLYHADATLVDVNNRPTSTTLPIDNLRITSGTDLAVDIDFPARSML